MVVEFGLVLVAAGVVVDGGGDDVFCLSVPPLVFFDLVSLLRRFASAFGGDGCRCCW